MGRDVRAWLALAALVVLWLGVWAIVRGARPVAVWIVAPCGERGAPATRTVAW